jgi:proline iminopeptidase
MGQGSRLMALGGRLWSLPFWAGLVLAGLIGLAAGIVGGVVAPRGPVTTSQALMIMALAAVSGVAAGAVSRTRWSLPVLLVGTFAGTELARAGVVAPSLAVRLDNVYGIIALVITRGVDGLLILLPATAGVLGGIAIGRRLVGAPSASRRRPIGSALVTLAAVGLAVVVAWPASTPPVLGSDGQPAPGSIAELTTVRLGGTDQTVMIRTANQDAPVLLYLSGGPGQSDLALSRALSEPWLDDFVFVDLDQRGNGSSYPAIDPMSSMTLDRAVSDVIELTDYLRARFDEPKILLMGESWGTILGVLAVQHRPDLYHAWLGSGQMVSVSESDRLIYDDLRAYAAQTGDTDLAAKLDEIGEPPYRDIPWANSNLLAWYEYLYKPYEPSPGYRERHVASGLDPFGMLGSEYAFIDKTNVLRGLVDTFSVMYPQLYDLDFRTTARTLDVPVWILDGAAELDGRRSLVLEWFEGLRAPEKHLVTFDGAAHSVAFEQADAVLRLLREEVVPATSGS